jgi:hypothetical protein
MPQSTKDSPGGKTHANKKSAAKPAVSDKAVAKKPSRSSTSPTGPSKHSEKKSTPH